jgi:hypothetical protein
MIHVWQHLPVVFNKPEHILGTVVLLEWLMFTTNTAQAIAKVDKSETVPLFIQ